MTIHNCQDLIFLFNNLFEQSENTILIGGGDEPLYLPLDETFPLNRIIFTRDYFASAMHEIAHWCIAGKERRTKVDYGYWYYPEGRNPEQQELFEQAEVKPQSLECIFSKTAGSPFVISVDNLIAGNNNTESFQKKITWQVQHYLTYGLPERAALFNNQLLIFYECMMKLAG